MYIHTHLHVYNDIIYTYRLNACTNTSLPTITTYDEYEGRYQRISHPDTPTYIHIYTTYHYIHIYICIYINYTLYVFADNTKIHTRSLYIVIIVIINIQNTALRKRMCDVRPKKTTTKFATSIPRFAENPFRPILGGNARVTSTRSPRTTCWTRKRSSSLFHHTDILVCTGVWIR